ncbi:MAG: sugar transferase [Planctomycetota bacterium]
MGLFTALYIQSLCTVGTHGTSLMLLLPIAAAAQGTRDQRRRAWAGSQNARNIVMVGRNARTRRHIELLARDDSGPVSVIGVLDSAQVGTPDDDCRDLLTHYHVPDLGGLENLSDVLRGSAVDEVLVTLPIKSCYDDIQSAVRTCEEAGVDVSLCADLFNSSLARPGQRLATPAAPRITYTSVPYPRWKLAIKRTVDIVGALVGLTLFLLPMLVIALGTKLTSRGPVFFSQTRAGLKNRPFPIFKFRTMIVNAEELKKEIEALNEVDGPVFKIRRDPRVTRFGSFLRKTSLDELPQLFNVLRGDMSLVGPRPPLLAEVEQYEWWQRRRLAMKPGLTCIWQVSGRSTVTFREWMRMDLRYIDNWSLWLDVKLILQTIPAVLVGKGAA